MLTTNSDVFHLAAYVENSLNHPSPQEASYFRH